MWISFFLSRHRKAGNETESIREHGGSDSLQKMTHTSSRTCLEIVCGYARYTYELINNLCYVLSCSDLKQPPYPSPHYRVTSLIAFLQGLEFPPSSHIRDFLCLYGNNLEAPAIETARASKLKKQQHPKIARNVWPSWLTQNDHFTHLVKKKNPSE